MHVIYTYQPHCTLNLFLKKGILPLFNVQSSSLNGLT